SFSESDILDSIHEIIVNKIESQKPKAPIGNIGRKSRMKEEKEGEAVVEEKMVETH
ncbi:hypothetical protein HY734_00595, partial [Candidatus Uhrbacteria bacterium]|nr:hypothetical protein [Candidatus Uhrbacteria bacterium]